MKFVIALITITIMLCSCSAPHSDTMAWSISKENVIEILGEPKDKSNDGTSSGKHALFYDETVYELQSESVYCFSNNRLYSIQYHFDVSDIDKAYGEFKTLAETLTTQYGEGFQLGNWEVEKNVSYDWSKGYLYDMPVFVSLFIYQDNEVLGNIEDDFYLSIVPLNNN